MKTSSVLAAAAAAVLTQASPPAPRQGAGLVTATLYAEFGQPEGAPTETLPLRAPGTTRFRAEGYAKICAVTHDRACEAYALLDGKPNVDAGHPEAGARERPLFISPAPDFDFKICVSQQGHTEMPDGTTRDDTWRVRGVRVACPGRGAVAARTPPAPASVERMGNTFFVHYDD